MYQTRLIAITLIVMLIAQLACAAPGGAGEPPTPTSSAAPAATSGDAAPTGETPPTDEALPPAPTDAAAIDAPTPEGGYPYLDPCTLVTADEAAATLGAPVQGDEMGFDRQFGGCQYHTDGFAQSMYVGAGYGGEAKGMILIGIGMLSQLTDDAAIDEFYSSLAARSSTTSLLDFYTEATVNMPEDPTGENVTPQPVTGIGDAAYYYWYADDIKAELTFVSGEKFALLRIEGIAEESARPALESLARQVLARMPAQFTTLNPPE